MEQPEIIKDRSIPFKQQMHILRRILKFAHPYRKEFTVAIIFSILLAIINAILPRIIQVFIDDHITPEMLL